MVCDVPAYVVHWVQRAVVCNILRVQYQSAITVVNGLMLCAKVRGVLRGR
jgi:hypothetical protein